MVDVGKEAYSMNLLIHDLSEEDWEKISEEYKGWRVISNNGNIKPCVGCFGCWVKEPGQCVIKDGYEKMGSQIHKAESVTVISRYTYGGFSSFVKNVFDRSIGWVLPYFEIYKGEMHHKKRYPEDKPIKFIFRGSGLTEDDKKKATRYVKAVCTNFRGIVVDVVYEKIDSKDMKESAINTVQENKTILLNCSLRADNANSKKFLDKLSEKINGEKESINLSRYINKLDELIDILAPVEKIVLGMPLYVDGIPSATLRVMEMLERKCKGVDKKIYVVANMGLYESVQIKNLLSMVKTWCDTCGYTYGGGIAIGAGEMLGSFMGGEISKGPACNVSIGFDKLSAAINTSTSAADIYADVCKFPRGLYMLIANMSWPRNVKNNGLKKKDLLRQL